MWTLEMLWLSPVAAFVNVLSTLLIGGILVWLADQSNLIPGGFPVQQIIDMIAELLRDNILKVIFSAISGQFFFDLYRIFPNNFHRIL